MCVYLYVRVCVCVCCVLADELAREEVCAAFLTEKLAGLVGRTVTAIECAAAARVLSPATRGPKVVAAVKTVYRTLVPGAKEIKGFDKLGRRCSGHMP